jgi:23S rRNA (guanine2445-N2)-methyltransferase / 23S rRNA (guanine2069-N7)-methyltransferase
MLATMANGKDFLNLFCYTATATVQAALAGAASSVSVDMSNTYIDWAEENFNVNNINSERHKLVQQDCITWLENCRQGFDVILLDPPSFSNSKRMDDVFDVQRDHAAMIHRCMDLLNHNGTLLFSNNLRSFKLYKDITDSYCVENITDKTLDRDFQRNRKIHQCFLIKA